MYLDITQYKKTIRRPTELDLFQKIKNHFMSNLLYVVAVILIIGWMVGYFGYHAGNLIHMLLFIGVIAIILRVIQGRNVL
jgi:hypothetical protein